jgi:ABC-type branched-subunit amino acid transport system substrate-binding protein/LysM repeat protein
MKTFLFTILVIAFTILNANNDCFHIVVKGDNLYRIGLMYKTNEEGLKKLNPDLSASLSLGQKVKVPCVDGLKPRPVGLNSSNSVSQHDEFQGNYIYHSIKKGETVYNITQKYGISEEQFFKDNSEVKQYGLKLGGVVRLYQRDKSSEDEIAIDDYFLKVRGKGKLNPFQIDTNKLQDSTHLKIAVMLPFSFEKNIEFLKRFKDEQEPQLRKKTKVFLELYQGIKMAIDSIVEAGLNVQLFVFDTKADSIEIKRIINQPIIKKMDLIIGPGYTHTFVYAANLLRGTSIPLVSPFSKKDQVIKGLPNTVRIIPSKKSHFKEIGKYVGENYLKDNVIIVTDNKNDQSAAKVVQREIIAMSLLSDSNKTVVPAIVEGFDAPIDSLQLGVKNIIILANNKEAFSSKLTAKLIPSSSKFEILLFGLEDLKKYKNIEVDYWDSLNIHITSASKIKYGSLIADQFLKSYFKKYYAEPSNSAFTGYDFTFLILSQLMEDKKYAHNKLVGNHFEGGIRDYRFKYNGDQNGISNNSVYVYKYSNFNFVKLND